MGMLDEALVKTKEVFDAACQRTGEIVSVEKQKFSIASLKSKREKDFAELGKIYFELICEENDLEDETRNLIDAINEKTEEIERLYEDIKNIKNKAICPNCNAKIDIGSTYCSNCGTRIS